VKALRFLLCLVATLVIVFAGAPAFADPVEISANVDANEIELGDTVTYTLQAQSPSDMPSDPKLQVPGGFSVVESGSSPSHMMSIINGHTTEKRGLTSQWRLRADRLGTFTIGPGSVSVGGARKSGAAQTVKVIAPGAGGRRPRRPRQQPFDPFGNGSAFDPFKGLFPQDDDSAGDPFAGLNPDAKLSLDAPRAASAFLHATVDKTRAVVGEQVTLTVYLYEDLQGRHGQPNDVHEANAPEFLKRSLVKDETRATHVGNTLIAGRPWAVKLVRKNALFPLKTGKLVISPMSLTLSQMRGTGFRESEQLVVDVNDPPVAGRPAGYQIGDTGDFSLSASVAPHTVDQHAAVGVTVELRGTGNMPSTLPLPEIAGVEWLEPQTTDDLGPVSTERFGGTRTFSYVVRIQKSGSVDLGEIRLPFYDPDKRAYSVARAALGIVQVTPGAGRDAGAEVAETILPGMPGPRAVLEGKRDVSFLAERPVYWGALFGSPLLCVCAIALTGAVRKIRERRANAAPTPAMTARSRRAEAEDATRGTDGKAATAAIARAVEADVLAVTGVNVRGTSGDERLNELVDAGVSEDAARAVVAVLASCEDARFSPSGVAIEHAQDLWKRAKEALGALAESRVTG
jgi:hypothetical protein